MTNREFAFGEYRTRRIEATPEGPIEGSSFFKFLAHMHKLTWQDGDEFWEYNTPEELWKQQKGEAGYAWYRNGAFLTGIPTMTWRIEECLTRQIEAKPHTIANMERQLKFIDNDASTTWQVGDELWEYSSPPRTWARLQGRRGIAWMRNGKVLYSTVSEMN